MKAERWSAKIAPVTEEFIDEVSPIDAESNNFEEAAAGKDDSNTETEGDFRICEVGG